MKKLLFTLCLILAGTNAFAQRFDEAESGDWAIGLNVPITWADKVHLGVQPKVQYYVTPRFRSEASFGYYFEASHRIDWDLNLNFHYLFPMKDTGLWIYPILGVQFLHRHQTVSIDDDDNQARVGLNIGAGFQYDIEEHLFVNAETKYTYTNDYDRGNVLIGIGYRF